MTALNVRPGDRYGRLVVLTEGERRPVPSKPNGVRTMWCQCDCGNVANVWLWCLSRGTTQSCGCIAKENLADHAFQPGHEAYRHGTHGLSGHVLFSTWRAMLYRCERPGTRSFKNYGARGIRVCDEWHDLAVFIAWIEANLGPRPDGMEIDRIDVDGNYEPGNVRWATGGQNNVNTRKQPGTSSRFKGVSITKEGRWAAQISVNRQRQRLGFFKNEEDAARAYDAAAVKGWGEFALLNFPQEHAGAQ